jgi:hypothetical protein
LFSLISWCSVALVYPLFDTVELRDQYCRNCVKMAERYEPTPVAIYRICGRAEVARAKQQQQQFVVASAQQVVDCEIALVQGDEQRRRYTRLFDDRHSRAIVAQHDVVTKLFPERPTSPSPGHHHGQHQPGLGFCFASRSITTSCSEWLYLDTASTIDDVNRTVGQAVQGL